MFHRSSFNATKGAEKIEASCHCVWTIFNEVLYNKIRIVTTRGKLKGYMISIDYS